MEGFVEEFETNREKCALFLLANTICAEKTVDGSVGDGVEDERGYGVRKFEEQKGCV